MAKGIGRSHWIRHSKLCDLDEYECSCCQAIYGKRYKACPNCGIVLIVEKGDDGKNDEAEKKSWLLGYDNNLERESKNNNRIKDIGDLSLIDSETFYDLLMEEQEQM